MNLVIPLRSIPEAGIHRVGGKAFSLGLLFRQGVLVPETLCITTEAYEMYVRTTGLLERISLELSRKDFGDMRWEELWDASLRIRSMFLNTAMPPPLVNRLKEAIEEVFHDRKVAVRSSVPLEDSTRASYAGLHESYLNVGGIYSILDHIRLVWASLWSDAALLHQKDLGLDVHHSTMAVTIQGLVVGERSGVFFGRNPTDASQAVIEAVYGLSQGLAEGSVEPDRWIIDRTDGRVISHTRAARDTIMVMDSGGISLTRLPDELAEVPPLDNETVQEIAGLGRMAEGLFGTPQDIEWAMEGPHLFVLQARPITAAGGAEQGDERSWYRGLTRSYASLRQLWSRIEKDLVPEMVSVAGCLTDEGLVHLTDASLADEIERRHETCVEWERAYRRYFIPFAHGMRLFGRFYNDTVRPHDPYEFMDLLRSSDLLSIKRNSRLEELACLVRRNPLLADALESGELSGFPDFRALLHAFIESFGDLPGPSPGGLQGSKVLLRVILQLAISQMNNAHPQVRPMEYLEEYYLSFFPEDRQAVARDLLRLARASYRLRDDDKIYLDRIKVHLRAALDEARTRIGERFPGIRDEEVPAALRDPRYRPSAREDASEAHTPVQFEVRMRQLMGQPAGSGVAAGVARVLRSDTDISSFRAGEVMVCDAIDPTMTFMVPLACAIVERRGGMLIHGAIIAREYGLPCVTGVPHAVSVIRTGDVLTVDGHLGIVTISTH